MFASNGMMIIFLLWEKKTHVDCIHIKLARYKKETLEKLKSTK